MPILYEQTVSTSVVTAAVDTVIAALFMPTGAGTRQAYLREVQLWTLTAPTTVGRLTLKLQAGTAGGFPPASAGIPRDPGAPASRLTIATSWSLGAPTVAADPVGALRRFTCPTAVGNGIIWTWYEDDGLVIPNGGGVCVCNGGSTAPGTWSATFVWSE